MVVTIFMATMLPVAQFTAMHGRKLSCFLLFWLLLVLGNLLKNTSRLIGCLTLLEESDQLERVSRHHHLVQVYCPLSDQFSVARFGRYMALCDSQSSCCWPLLPLIVECFPQGIMLPAATHLCLSWQWLIVMERHQPHHKQLTDDSIIVKITISCEKIAVRAIVPHGTCSQCIKLFWVMIIWASRKCEMGYSHYY